MRRRLTEDQRARVEVLATERRGRPAKGAALRGWVAQRVGTLHPRRSDVDGLPVGAKDVHPRGAYRYFTIHPGETIGA